MGEKCEMGQMGQMGELEMGEMGDGMAEVLRITREEPEVER